MARRPHGVAPVGESRLRVGGVHADLVKNAELAGSQVVEDDLVRLRGPVAPEQEPGPGDAAAPFPRAGVHRSGQGAVAAIGQVDQLEVRTAT